MMHFTSRLPPAARILDLGSGDGRHSLHLADLGHEVVAVDRRPAPPAYPGVEWHTSDILEWLQPGSRERFDAALIRNVIQFFRPEDVSGELLPRVRDIIMPGGLVDITTFTRPPEPPFQRPLASTWTAAEIADLFPGWTKLLAEEDKEDGPGLDGVHRLFHLVRLIVRKPRS